MIYYTNFVSCREYLENLIYIETVIKEIELLLESYYKDNNTAFIFTSDHGMTDWGNILSIWSLIQLFDLIIFSVFVGSHGDSSTSETDTPIVTWGAGLSYAKKHNSLPVNIQQADVAPLMATLIGVPIPVHSVVCNNFVVEIIILLLCFISLCF